MNKLLNKSLKRFLLYAAIVLVISVPVYYATISLLWEYEMNEHNIVLTAEAARHDSYMIITAVTVLTALFFVSMMAGFILLNKRFSKRLWKPFYNSLEQIRDFNLHQQRPVAFADTDIEEFAELNQRLQQLISGSIAAYGQQKEFADNASHELQTPLAIVQSKLELLLQSQPLNTTQYELIEDAIKALTRVSRINKNLLLLTKIENSQYMDQERIDLSGLLENTLQALLPFIGNKQLQIKKEITPQIHVNGNRILVEILLSNLLVNAIRYSPEASSIELTLAADRLMISNSGQTPLDQEQLFKRFATASSQKPGTGLGLAIVKEICTRYNWEISYTHYDHFHRFMIRF
ncbi:MAG: HAMP domain-containing histidine kinase [Chitinophagaceae bacterium]|nr:HAMP domain-containing histidine kinase [Chitinophagaceae bacterium]